MPAEAALPITHGPGAHQRMIDTVLDGTQLPGGLAHSFAPTLSSATSFQLRSDGAALTAGLHDTRSLIERGNGRGERDALEIEISEGGIVRILATYLSIEVNDQQQLVPELMPTLTRQIVAIAVAVAQQTSYGGMWALGVCASDTAGLQVYETRNSSGGFGQVRTDRYEKFTEASTLEMSQHPGAVTRRLVGEFVRGAGVADLATIRPLLE